MSQQDILCRVRHPAVTSLSGLWTAMGWAGDPDLYKRKIKAWRVLATQGSQRRGPAPVQ